MVDFGGRAKAGILAIALVIIIAGAAVGALIATVTGWDIVWTPVITGALAFVGAVYYVKEKAGG